MGIYRIPCTKDTWITNRIIDNNSSVRATGSNFGADPSLNVYAFEPDILTGTMDVARSLLKFDMTELSGKIYEDLIIPSSSVTYLLKMYDMKHEDRVPSSFDLFIYPLSRSWDEGRGIDTENFRDYGYANWHSASSTVEWTTTGSDFISEEYGTASQHFDYGYEDLEVDISDIVINWLTSSVFNNDGILIKFGATEENGDASSVDFYRKAFHGRESKYIEKLPVIEARWDNVIKDNRSNFAYNQNNKLYLYNFIRGELTDLTNPVIVKIQDHLKEVSASYL